MCKIRRYQHYNSVSYRFVKSGNPLVSNVSASDLMVQGSIERVNCVKWILYLR